MGRKARTEVSKRPICLLLVEGDTEVSFYGRIKSHLLGECRVTIRNLEGLHNINAKIIEEIVNYTQRHGDERIKVYCCLDREARYGEIPGFDIKRVKKYIKNERIRVVLSIDAIRATRQVESWFFYDIEGIYEFLRVPKAKRNLRTFRPPEKFGYKDLQKLFERYGKTYTKGRRAENFINHLDIKKIASNCRELNDRIELIKSQANDLTNHLSRGKTQAK